MTPQRGSNALLIPVVFYNHLIILFFYSVSLHRTTSMGITRTCVCVRVCVLSPRPPSSLLLPYYFLPLSSIIEESGVLIERRSALGLL